MHIRGNLRIGIRSYKNRSKSDTIEIEIPNGL